jgi:hypothetical protein
MVIAREGQVHQLGTGILFQVGEASFVVTAAHVAKYASEYRKTLAISSSAGSFIVIAGPFLCSFESKEAGETDPFDIAVHRLSMESVQRLAGKSFLRFSDIDFQEASPTAVYSLFGFPTVWSRTNAASDVLELKALQFTTYRFDRDKAAIEGFQDRYHLLLDAQPNGITNDDGSAAIFCDLSRSVKELQRFSSFR